MKLKKFIKNQSDISQLILCLIMIPGSNLNRLYQECKESEILRSFFSSNVFSCGATVLDNATR